MISSEGSDVSICISRSVAFGKILFRSPRIGEIASPGREAIADTDHIASSTPERNRTFACLDFHCQWIYTPTQQVLYQSRAGRHVAGPPCRIGCTYLPCCFTQRT